MANCHHVISPTTPHEGNQNPNVGHHDLLAGPGEACAEHLDRQHPQYERPQQKSPEQNPDTALSRAPWRCSRSPSRPRVRPRTAAGLARTPPPGSNPPRCVALRTPAIFRAPTSRALSASTDRARSHDYTCQGRRRRRPHRTAPSGHGQGQHTSKHTKWNGHGHGHVQVHGHGHGHGYGGQPGGTRRTESEDRL